MSWVSREGFEPSTHGLKVRCSTAELPTQHVECRRQGAPGRPFYDVSLYYGMGTPHSVGLDSRAVESPVSGVGRDHPAPGVHETQCSSGELPPSWIVLLPVERYDPDRR